jgi:hypothetical protein
LTASIQMAQLHDVSEQVASNTPGAAVVTNRQPREWFKALEQMRADDDLPSPATDRVAVALPDQRTGDTRKPRCGQQKGTDAEAASRMKRGSVNIEVQ